MAFHHSTLVRALLVTVAALPLAANVQGQGVTQAGATPARLELSSSSEQAKSLFRESLFESQNAGGTLRIRRAIDSAVKLDPQFALGRVYQAFTSPGTAEVRAQGISDLLAGMGSATAPEVLLALYWRESAAGRAAAAVPILRALADLVSGDADVAWAYTGSQTAGKPVQEQVNMRTEFSKRFPGFAAVHNTLAYQLAPNDPEGALAEVREYVRLAPNHPNPHDSYADILLLQRRPAEALPHAQRTIELAPELPGGPMKVGLIHLMLGDAAAARADFAQGRERSTEPATKREFMYWTAASYAYTGDGKSAVRELTNILAMTQTPAQTAVVHERLAAVEAYLGTRKQVAAHLTEAGAGTPPATHYAIKAIVYARIGDLEQARGAAAQFTSMVPATNTFAHTLNALIAMQSNDLVTADREIAAAPQNDLFTKAVRADVLMRKGQKADAAALRQDVVTSSIKLDGNPPLDFFKLMATMHANKL